VSSHPDAERLSILLLCDDNPRAASTILEHIGALKHLSRHRVRTFNPRRMSHRFLDFDEFDAAVIHYSLLCTSDDFLHHTFRESLARYRGLKVQFIQDEYRWIDEITGAIRDMGVHALFTCLPQDEAQRVYGPRLPGVTLVPTLTGYVPDSLVGLDVPPPRQRPIDIGYRARKLPYWLGDLGQKKYLIGKGILDRADRYGLRCDISWREEDRMYGRRWIEFLESCRATLGSGSGSSIADYDGSIQRSVDGYVKQHPGATYEEVREKFLRPYEGTLGLDVISPRIFEGIALRTALVLFPSPYSGVIRPGEHYLPLAEDFSNLDEVVAKLRDDTFVTELTDRAYRDVIASGRYSFRELVREFDAVVDAGAHHHARRRVPLGYVVARLDRGQQMFRVRLGLP
jgi:hypothetical protein